MPTLADRQNPWLGLAAYGESERDFFFGRAHETSELIRLVEDEPLVVFYGVSGLGKTSLLQAGLFPRLRERDFLPVLLRLFHDAENTAGFSGYTAELVAAVSRASSSSNAKGPDGASAPATLWEFFHHRDAQFWSARNRLLTPVLLFDQFEEFFTLGSETGLRRTNSAQFFQQLSDLIYNRPPASFRTRLERGQVKADNYTFDPVRLRVVLSLREDFLPQLSEMRERGFPTLLKAALRLRPLSGEAARECIERPAPELLARGVALSLVRFLAGAESGATTVNEATTASGRVESVEPALLSVVCRELNAERIRRGLAQINADLLTLSQEQILGDFHERSWHGLAPELRRFVEDELLSPGGFRDSRALDDALSRPGITQRDIAQLIDRRLLHYQDRQDGPRRIELTHDLLCRVVRASRRRREDEERTRAAAAAQHRAEEEALAAATRATAAEAERVKEKNLRTEAEAAQARARRFAFAAIGLAVLAAGAMGFAVHLALVANDQRGAAESSAQQAQAAKNAADELIHYMQFDLMRETTGNPAQMAVLQSINARIRNYFDRYPPAEGDVTTLREKAMALRQQGYLLQGQGQLDKALEVDRASLEIGERLAALHPENTDFIADLGYCHNCIGGVLQAQGKLDEALESYTAGLKFAQRASEREPRNPERMRDLAANHTWRGNLLFSKSRLEEAREAYANALVIYQHLAQMQPDIVEWKAQSAYANQSAGLAYQALKKFDDALLSFREALTLAQQPLYPGSTAWDTYAAYIHDSIGATLYAQGKFEESLSEYRASHALREAVVQREPQSVQWQANLAYAARSVGDVLVALKRSAEARRLFASYRDIVDRLVAQDPANYLYSVDRATARNRMARSTDLTVERERTEARALMQEAVEILRALRDSPTGLGPLDANALQDYEQFLQQLQPAR